MKDSENLYSYFSHKSYTKSYTRGGPPWGGTHPPASAGRAHKHTLIYSKESGKRTGIPARRGPDPLPFFFFGVLSFYFGVLPISPMQTTRVSSNSPRSSRSSTSDDSAESSVGRRCLSKDSQFRCESQL